VLSRGPSRFGGYRADFPPLGGELVRNRLRRYASRDSRSDASSGDDDDQALFPGSRETLSRERVAVQWPRSYGRCVEMLQSEIDR
jgi:hypothetical protein